jgi:hypothetical protein
MTRMVKTGSSYLSQSELPLTFGLGKAGANDVVSLEVVWPSGRRESVPKVKLNQFITLEEAKGVVSSLPMPISNRARQ